MRPDQSSPASSNGGNIREAIRNPLALNTLVDSRADLVDSAGILFREVMNEQRCNEQWLSIQSETTGFHRCRQYPQCAQRRQRFLDPTWKERSLPAPAQGLYRVGRGGQWTG